MQIFTSNAGKISRVTGKMIAGNSV